MKQIIIWKGLYYQSLEYCEVAISGSDIEVTSTIIGSHDGTAYRVDYDIDARPTWEIVSCRIESRVGEAVGVRTFQYDGKGNWTRDGETLAECKGATEIDISVTPLTNSFPINRLKLPVAQSRQIQVVYIDLLGQTFKRATQQYTRISDFEYRYQNVPNDFEAVISVDESGIVRVYPELFSRQND